MTAPNAAPPRTRAALRRANPLYVFAAGTLVGALLVAIVKAPEEVTEVGTVGNRPSAAGGQDPGAATDDVIGGVEAAGGAIPGVDAGRRATGSGATSPAGRGGPTAPAATVSDACAGAKSKGVQGVTDTTIKIGFGVPDLSVFAALGEQINPGDIPAKYRAALDGLRREGRLPICGRDIEPHFRSYNVLAPEQSRSACVGWAEEDEVFAAVTLFGFSAPDCITREHRMPLLDMGNTVYDANFVNNPLLFTTDPSNDAQLRAVANWIVSTGIVKGKKTGVYYYTNGVGGAAPPGRAVEQSFIAEMKRLGEPLDLVVASEAASAGSVSGPDPNTSLAVQRFKNEGIEVAMPFGDSRFFDEAKNQDYKAQWIRYGVAQASDATTSGSDPQWFDGALGLLFNHVGEEASGIPLSPEERLCFGYWERAGGEPVQRRDWAAGQVVRETCDVVNLITRALAAAGSNLTLASFVNGMETIKDLRMAYYATQTFSREKHSGATENLVQRWYGSCDCWKVAAPWSRLFGLA